MKIGNPFKRQEEATKLKPAVTLGLKWLGDKSITTKGIKKFPSHGVISVTAYNIPGLYAGIVYLNAALHKESASPTNPATILINDTGWHKSLMKKAEALGDQYLEADVIHNQFGPASRISASSLLLVHPYGQWMEQPYQQFSHERAYALNSSAARIAHLAQSPLISVIVGQTARGILVDIESIPLGLRGLPRDNDSACTVATNLIRDHLTAFSHSPEFVAQ
jgi:hypothetical protein